MNTSNRIFRVKEAGVLKYLHFHLVPMLRIRDGLKLLPLDSFLSAVV